MTNGFFGKNKTLVSRSSQAICHPRERELVISRKDIDKTAKQLRKMGKTIIGSNKISREGVGRIWFI